MIVDSSSVRKRPLRTLFAACLLCTLPPAPAWAEMPVLRVGYDSWVGDAGVFIAAAKGFFEKEGIKVELHDFPGPVDTIPPTVAGNLDIALTTPDNVMLVDANQGTDLVNIAFIDASTGADAIVAQNGIANIAGLRGKKIAVTIGQCNQLLLLKALEKAGLKESDVTLVNMDADSSGAAFIAGRLDAAVTWEPWVTQATSTGKGHVIFSSKDAPAVIFDSVAVTRKFAALHARELSAFMRATDAGVAWLRSHPDEGAAIVAARLSSTPADVAQMLKGVTIYDLDDNRRLLGGGPTDGEIYRALDGIADFQLAHRLVETKPEIGTMVDGDLTRGAQPN
jgi:NitT/TauT family transport system substrate-binding protein